MKTSFIIVILLLCIAQASAATEISISPASRSIATGESFLVNISVIPDTAIAGMQFDLRFDADLIRVNGVEEGCLLNQDGAPTSFIDGTIDNTAGTITNVFACILGKNNVTTPGVFAIISMTAKGSFGISGLDLDDVIVSDPYGYSVDIDVTDGTVTVSEGTAPVLTDPGANPTIIPDDTDNDPRWGETSQLSITVTDDGGIAGVTLDLSPIGGSSTQPMTHIGDNIWSVTASASAGTPPQAYDLQVTATDTDGKSSSSSISLRIIMNGDVSANDAVNIADAMLLANYVAYPGQYTIISESVADVTGNGVVSIADAMLLANYAAYPDQYTLR